MSAVITRLVPRDAAECARMLSELAREGQRVRIVGGDTKHYLGERSPAISTELRTERLGGIVDHVPADLTVTVGGGARVADLADALARHGQFLPLDPPHAEAATVGGTIAANSGGFWGARYGGVRDLLIGTRTALVDGTVVRGGGRVVKNVAGYDLNKLLVGSLGTLGVIVEATMKVLPIPPARGGAVATFGRAADAFAAAAAIARAPARAESVVVARGQDRKWRVFTEARGEKPAVTRAIDDAKREASARGGVLAVLGDELAHLRALPGRAADGAVVRVALPLAALSAFADAAASFESFAELVADAATGVARVHLRGDDDDVIHETEATLLAARAIDGEARVERRADHLREALSAWAAAPRGEFLMRRIKDAFDPSGTLEPGRSAIG